ncbi:MAG: hypothetical protein IKA16_00245 [Oscillospiraceae bacterium]|nr:hypothetical protein [Oscillospiraceae bacterium]
MKKHLFFIFVLILALAITGCKNDAPGGEIQIGREYDFSGVTQVKLVNGHSGYSTTITNEADMANIISFVGDTVGKPLGSGKGYYEGSYSVVFLFDNGEEFHLTYGDDTVFYTGEGNDGYPVRYRLIHMNISDDVIPFFSQYDLSTLDSTETSETDESRLGIREFRIKNNENGTWELDGITYKYRLEITGRMPNASADITFVYLSNLETITFDQAWKSSGYSSNTADYFAAEDAVLVEVIAH